MESQTNAKLIVMAMAFQMYVRSQMVLTTATKTTFLMNVILQMEQVLTRIMMLFQMNVNWTAMRMASLITTTSRSETLKIAIQMVFLTSVISFRDSVLMMTKTTFQTNAKKIAISVECQIIMKLRWAST